MDMRCLTSIRYSASVDNIRLWNVAESVEDSKTKSGVQFKIIPGHHGGYISQMRMSLIMLALSFFTYHETCSC